MRQSAVSVIEAALRRPRRPYEQIAVRPLSPLIGAEIEGLDLRRPLAEAELAELRRAFLENHVLTFRDQWLTPPDLLKVGGLLGLKPEPALGPASALDWLPVAPLLASGDWRADETYREAPPAAGLLHVASPPGGAGGDMLFANMHLALELLDDPLRALLLDMTAVHTAGVELVAEHPVVIRHPITGRAALFVNRTYTSHLVGHPEHSQATLDMLFRHLEMHPVLSCRVRWTPNTLVAWDTCCTQHLMLQDFQSDRLFARLVRLQGDPPRAFGGEAQ